MIHIADEAAWPAAETGVSVVGFRTEGHQHLHICWPALYWAPSLDDLAGSEELTWTIRSL